MQLLGEETENAEITDDREAENHDFLIHDYNDPQPTIFAKIGSFLEACFAESKLLLTRIVMTFILFYVVTSCLIICIEYFGLADYIDRKLDEYDDEDDFDDDEW